MLTLDAQVHVYERDHPGRPWLHALHGPPEVSGDDMVAAMDSVGVDGALLVSPITIYGYDASYAMAVHAAHPGRFALIKPVDPTDSDVEDTIAAWASIDGAVGIRLVLIGGASTDPADPGINRVLATAARYSLPVNVVCWGRLVQVVELAARNANTLLLLDHLGLRQPIEPPAAEKPFAELPKLLALKAYDNVVVKITCAGSLSREPFPYSDLWDPLGRIFDAFGLARCMWGSDWTRALDFLTYKQAVDSFRLTDRLSDSDRAVLMSETLQRIYKWSPSSASSRKREDWVSDQVVSPN